jgi:hypothetical protein
VTSPEWAEGLHERLLTYELSEQLTSVGDREVVTAEVDHADQPHVLARYVYSETVRALNAVRDPDRRVALVDRIMEQLSDAQDDVLAPPRQLLRLAGRSGPGITTYEETRPSTPLSDAALLTNSKGEPSLGAELKAEIDTSDEVVEYDADLNSAVEMTRPLVS